MHMLTSRTAETGATIRTVAVVGLGYIGLPTAAILATNGLEVIGVDVNQGTVDAVNNGDVPFVEPDLGIHVAGAVSQGRLRAQIQTDPRYFAFVDRAAPRDILGVRLPVARLEDVLHGKIWAVTDASRRPSKRQKDLADIARLLEVYPELRSQVPADVAAKLVA